MEENYFSENLKLLCSYERSVSDACRSMDINRQQFSKYLGGISLPSNRNMRKICSHFNVRISDLHLPHNEFQFSDAVQSREFAEQHHQKAASLQSAFENQHFQMKKFLGTYLAHFYSFSWPGKIICALTILEEKDGIAVSKTIERVRDPRDNSLFLSKYSGQATMLGGRIFVIEFQSLAKDAIVESILYPMSRSQLTYMQGQTFGISSRRRHPYMAQTVWKFLGSNADLKESMKLTGLYDPDSRQIDPKIRMLLGEPQVISGRPEFEEG